VKINIIFENNSDLELSLDLIKKIASFLTNKDIELLVVSNEEIKKLNKNFRNKDEATDVLSFPYEDMPKAPLGSIVISTDFLLNYSKQFNHSIDNEFALLFIHGLLHLLGYNHEIDNGEHRDKEKEIIKKFNLPKSLIIRTIDDN